MKVALGVDTLSYHCRLVEGELTVEDLLEEVRSLEASYVQMDLRHVMDRDEEGLSALRRAASALGLGILVSGDFVGTPRAGDTPALGVARIAGWARKAELLGSPVLRVASGFYRAELATQPELIQAEKHYVIETLRAATEKGIPGGIRLLLENHSDFTPEEYIEIIESVGPDKVGVFLDLINPVSTLSDPESVVYALAPYATCGHVKDYRFESVYVPDRYHRRGFDVRWCYPGEGAAHLPALLQALKDKQGEGTYQLAIEGLDSQAGVADQPKRLGQSLAHLRSLLGEDFAPQL